MPRLETLDHGLKMIPVDFERLALPGSFERAMWQLIDSWQIDMSGLEAGIRNDAGGAQAGDPLWPAPPPAAPGTAPHRAAGLPRRCR